MKNYNIISFHPGRQHNLEQAYQLSKRFKGFKHITSLYFSKQSLQKLRFIPSPIFAALNKRSFELGNKIVDVNPWPEIKLLWNKKVHKQLRYIDFIKRNKEFQKWIVDNYTPPKVCIGFDTCSWYLFEKWKNKSFLVLDLSIAIPQYKLSLAKQNNINGEVLKKLLSDDADVYEIYAKEIELADLILCGSDFVKQSCSDAGIDSSKLFVLPYGADLNKFTTETIQPEASKIKVAFIGSVTYRKGADIMLQTWTEVVKKYPSAELHFFGSVEIEIPSNLKNVFFHGFVSHEILIKELQTFHISVLPSFFEGSSLAIYQSMAMGLATITTPNAGSIIENGKNGLLVQFGSVEELAKAISLLIDHPDLRYQLASYAREDIKEFTWDNYGRKLGTVLETIMIN